MSSLLSCLASPQPKMRPNWAVKRTLTLDVRPRRAKSEARPDGLTRSVTLIGPWFA